MVILPEGFDQCPLPPNAEYSVIWIMHPATSALRSLYSIGLESSVNDSQISSKKVAEKVVHISTKVMSVLME
jgi:hypothetical protein